MYHNEKVLKASDQRDIVWFVSSACYLRRHWPECFGRVKRTFCFTGAIDILLGVVVRRPINAVLGFLFLWIISQLFLRVSNRQLVGKMKPGREFDSRLGLENFLCPGRAWFLLLPS